MPEPAHIQAHKHAADHREEILQSDVCGCFYCRSTFPPTVIREWWDHGTTAVCPHCGIDAVIGSASGFPITERFLTTMHRHWF